jgi:hypothetical protein
VKKKTSKGKSVKSLPAKRLTGKTAKGVKGGFPLGAAIQAAPDDLPSESLNFNYGKIKWVYTQQKGTGKK